MDEQMVKEYTDKLKALEDRLAEIETQNKSLAEENETLKKFKTDLEFQAMKKDVGIIIEKALADGKIVPAVAPMFAALALNEGPGVRTYSVKEGEEEKSIEYSSNINLIRQIVENSPKAVIFEQTTQDIQPETEEKEGRRPAHGRGPRRKGEGVRERAQGELSRGPQRRVEGGVTWR